MFGLKRKEQQVNNHTVPVSWIRRACKASEFTPDIQELERYQDCLVFLYNETMEGQRANGTVLYGSHSIVPAYTLDSNMSLWNKNLGKASFPIALRYIQKKSSDHLSSSKELHRQSPWRLDDVIQGRIKGELHLVNPRSIKRLDEYLLNGVQFRRERAKFIVPAISSKPDGTTIQTATVVHAFFYEGIRNYWYDQLDCGVRFSIFPNHFSTEFKYLKSYYEYNSLTPSTVSNMHQL